MKKVNMILPAYVDKFRCIGGVCEDNCCIGWNVDVDKKTFKMLHKLNDDDLKKKIQKCILNNPECMNEDLDYGRIKMDKNHRCPLLTEDNYCSVQAKYGQDYISSVCSQYPRIVNKVDDKYEMSIDIGCPEAARIILGCHEKVTFHDAEKDLGKYTMAGVLDTRREDFKDTPIKYFKEIRDFSIKIIQNRNLSISCRLFVLGNFIDKLDDESNIDVDNLKQIIDEYDINKVAESYTTEKMNYVLQVSFIKNVLDILNIYDDNEKIIKYSETVFKEFNLEDSDYINNNSDRYINIFEEYEEKYIKKYSYIFENYLVNFIYNNLFPFSESDFMFDGYIMLLTRYSLIRFYLAGLYCNNKNESPENIIKFIHIFAKTLEHNSDYRMEMLDYLKYNGFDNMEFAKTLL